MPCDETDDGVIIEHYEGKILYNSDLKPTIKLPVNNE